jgi:hypothetical protein
MLQLKLIDLFFKKKVDKMNVTGLARQGRVAFLVFTESTCRGRKMKEQTTVVKFYRKRTQAVAHIRTVYYASSEFYE